MQDLPLGYKIHENAVFVVFDSFILRALPTLLRVVLSLLIAELGTSRRKRFSVGIKRGPLLLVSSLFSELELVVKSLSLPLSFSRVSLSDYLVT